MTTTQLRDLIEEELTTHIYCLPDELAVHRTDEIIGFHRALHWILQQLGEDDTLLALLSQWKDTTDRYEASRRRGDPIAGEVISYRDGKCAGVKDCWHDVQRMLHPEEPLEYVAVNVRPTYEMEKKS